MYFFNLFMFVIVIGCNLPFVKLYSLHASFEETPVNCLSVLTLTHQTILAHNIGLTCVEKSANERIKMKIFIFQIRHCFLSFPLFDSFLSISLNLKSPCSTQASVSPNLLQWISGHENHVLKKPVKQFVKDSTIRNKR